MVCVYAGTQNMRIDGVGKTRHITLAPEIRKSKPPQGLEECLRNPLICVVSTDSKAFEAGENL